MLIRNAEVAGLLRDIRLRDGEVVAISAASSPLNKAPSDSPTPTSPNDDDIDDIDARGGALLPGLHDHHIHLHALAAATLGFRCGPPDVTDEAALRSVLSAAKPDSGWLRGTGYFESVAGDLDRHRLDALRDDLPLRIQHRSGVMWFVNSSGIEALKLDSHPVGIPAGAVERDASGRATGRIFRADDWLRTRLPASTPPDLATLGAELAGYGVTALTDCTPTNSEEELARFRLAQETGALPQRLCAMGTLGIANASNDRLQIGAHKIMLDEPALPDFDGLIARVRAAHGESRGVAFHCVTRAEIIFALAALRAAKTGCGNDRIEHASVAPPELFEEILSLGVTIVTQPNFVYERGDGYLENVAPLDIPHLYRLKSWTEAGIALGGGTDSPFGRPDPWQAMRAAVDRRTATGQSLGPEEALSPEEALALFSPVLGATNTPSETKAPGLEVGAPADLCLLDVPWSIAREPLSADHVRAVFCAGIRV